MINKEQKEAFEAEIKELEAQKENLPWMERLDVDDKIHNIKMKLNGVKPTDSHIDCIGCGS